LILCAIERGIIVAYTKDEIKSFEEKDLRISKLAIVKSLIEKLPLEDVYEVKKITELTEKYVDYVYLKRGEAGCVSSVTKHEVNWEQIAIGLNLAIPNSQNVKMLNHLIDEHKKATKASVNPKAVLVHILKVFGQYPTKIESVTKVLESLI